MKLVGWIYDEDICPWTKVFDIDVQPNIRFGNVPFEEITSNLVKCDLNGMVEWSGNHDLYFLDYLFEIFGCNLKACYNDKSTVLYDGNPIFSKAFHENEIVDSSQSHKAAQCTIIDGKYMYFNMTSYDFWDNIFKFISDTLHRSNLGGNLVKIGYYLEIDKQFKEII